MLDTNEKINKIYDMLIMLGYDEILRINKYPSNDNKNYSYIRIYNKNACKERMLSYLKNNSEVTNVMTFGTIEGKYDITIKENSFNEMVKQVRKKYEPVSF